MQYHPVILIGAFWLIFLGYWIHAARNVKRPRVREPALQRILDYARMMVSAALIFYMPGGSLPFLGLRVWPAAPIAVWLGVALCAAGIVFAVWARAALADNWSAEVQIKENHTLITGGPYQIVRHPIYTGILLALIGTWMTVGSMAGLIVLALAFTAVRRKMMLEEQFMRETFPGEYPGYAARVKRLVPGIF